MLTIKENLLETIKGGNPDRFVNQYEFLGIIMEDPLSQRNLRPKRGEPDKVDGWGVTISWPDHVPGPFPVHDEEHKVLKDITKWRDVVQAPGRTLPRKNGLIILPKPKLLIAMNNSSPCSSTGYF